MLMVIWDCQCVAARGGVQAQGGPRSASAPCVDAITCFCGHIESSATQLYSTVSFNCTQLHCHSVTVRSLPAASPTTLLFASLPLAVLLCASLLDPEQMLELPPNIRTLTSLQHSTARRCHMQAHTQGG